MILARVGRLTSQASSRSVSRFHPPALRSLVPCCNRCGAWRNTSGCSSPSSSSAASCCTKRRASWAARRSRRPLRSRSSTATRSPTTIYISPRSERDPRRSSSATGRSLSQDDTRRIENGVFDQMVTEVLLSEQYRKRGIVVTRRRNPRVRALCAAALDHQRARAADRRPVRSREVPALLASAQARQSGLLASARAVLPQRNPARTSCSIRSRRALRVRRELWRAWRDQHDSAQVSYVAFTPTSDTAAAKAISDADLRAYFDQHKAEFAGHGPGVSVRRHDSPRRHRRRQRGREGEGAALREEIVEGREVRGRRQARVHRHAFRRARAAISARAAKADSCRVREGRLRAQGRRALAAGADAVRLSHHPRRQPQGRYARAPTHPRPHPASDSTTTPHRRGSRPAVARPRRTSEQGAKLDTAAKQLGLPDVQRQAFEDQPATSRTVRSCRA